LPAYARTQSSQKRQTSRKAAQKAGNRTMMLHRRFTDAPRNNSSYNSLVSGHDLTIVLHALNSKRYCLPESLAAYLLKQAYPLKHISNKG
jgi:hypothetical protein